MTRILSGVDDITINGCNKNKSPKKDELELVSLKVNVRGVEAVAVSRPPNSSAVQR